ncbi:MAG: hypothetical protein K2P81_13375 [Bacteriovoracaceae bacterium]|nr:hypothetical protein [Bacteriovoracaceae bacterium]
MKPKNYAYSLIFFLLTFSAFGKVIIYQESPADLKNRLPYISQAKRVEIPLKQAPVEMIRVELEKLIGESLNHEAEAVIPLITHEEWRMLSSVLKMSDLDLIVEKEKMMTKKIDLRCIKKITTEVKDKKEVSWFLSFSSPELVKVRKQIWRKFIMNGGLAEDFQPTRWSPNVTLGFNSAVFSDEDKMSKDKIDCEIELKSN